jgi:cobalt-zinc-cadmium efflux system membrane fusion protein
MIKRVLVGVGLVASGAVGLYLVQQWYVPAPVVPVATGASTPELVPTVPSSARRLTMDQEARGRVGLQTSVVPSGGHAATRRLPAVVEPHGYRVVDVTSLVAGTLIDVRAELGQLIRQGAVVARLRSPEMTDEVRRWLTMRAERDVAVQRLARTESLARIGAASRQDLEENQSNVVRARTELDTARARLERLGLSETRLAALGQGDTLPDTFDILAPAGGVVISRAANPGQNVDAAQPVITLADRGTVWVIGNVFEADVAHVREGQRARVTSETYPGRVWEGTVAYIDPVITGDTRTAKVRVEVANRDEALRFGMFVTLALDVPGAASGVAVPDSAVQSLGAVKVVYIEVEPGQFEEREVSQVRAGDRVVTAGSFALRAERERLGWPPPEAAGHATPPTASAPMAAATPAVAVRVVEITAAGLVPARVTVPANQPVDLVFIRRVTETCGTQVEIPDLKVLRDLPLDQRVSIRLPPQSPRELSFSCGMDMLKGVIIVR